VRCGARDAAECLHDHFYPRLRMPKLNAAGTSIRALATCHADRKASLSVSLKDGRVVVNCFATNCTREAIRRSLIRLNVSTLCLPRAS
jgi:hypothetical protein